MCTYILFNIFVEDTAVVGTGEYFFRGLQSLTFFGAVMVRMPSADITAVTEFTWMFSERINVFLNLLVEVTPLSSLSTRPSTTTSRSCTIFTVTSPPLTKSCTSTTNWRNAIHVMMTPMWIQDAKNSWYRKDECKSFACTHFADLLALFLGDGLRLLPQLALTDGPVRGHDVHGGSLNVQLLQDLYDSCLEVLATVFEEGVAEEVPFLNDGQDSAWNVSHALVGGRLRFLRNCLLLLVLNFLDTDGRHLRQRLR